MLAIRMQRTGRSGHAQFRVIVQDGRFSPKSGRVTAYVGSYDPHSKAAILDKEKIALYLGNGAQPSDRVARLLKKEGVTLPDWVKLEADKVQDVKHPEKLRKNRPAGAEAPTEAVEAAIEETPPEETPVEEASAEVAEPLAEVKTEQPAAEPDLPARASAKAEAKSEDTA